MAAIATVFELSIHWMNQRLALQINGVQRLCRDCVLLQARNAWLNDPGRGSTFRIALTGGSIEG